MLEQKIFFGCFLGVFACTITELLIIEPCKSYILEIQYKQNSEYIFCSVNKLFYYLIHLAQPISGLPSNYYSNEEYYISKDGYNLKINKLKDFIILLKDKTTSSLISEIRKNKTRELEDIYQEIMQILESVNILPYELEITKIKFNLYKMQKKFKNLFIDANVGTCTLYLFELYELYKDILFEINNNAFLLNQKFLPSGHNYIEVNINNLFEQS